MVKVTFMGAGSTVFARNVIGDSFCTEVLKDGEFALYDIDQKRLDESYELLTAMRNTMGVKAVIKKYCGVENRREALRGADFVVNAIQVGLYDPCTIIDFEVPKKFGLRQTIADTLGIGGIFRALRTIPVMEGFAEDIAAVCPNAWFLNYTNPMAMLSGYMQRYTDVKTVGLCHSVQVVSDHVLSSVDMREYIGKTKYLTAGINHMGWLLKITDMDGNDLYPEIRRRANEILENPPENHKDLVRLEYVRRLGYYCTESSEHNAEYNMFFIKSKYPELIDRYNIPLDEYPRRCVNHITAWAEDLRKMRETGVKEHATRSHEYASRIMESIVTNTPYKIGGNVLNSGNLIENLPADACVEVPCLVDGNGVQGCRVGRLPVQCAAMNMTNVNVQLLTIEAAKTRKRETIYQAAMLEPHTASELSIDDIVALCDALIEAHGDWLPKFE